MHQRSRAPLRDHWVSFEFRTSLGTSIFLCPSSVCPSVCHTFGLLNNFFNLERQGFHIWHVCSLWQELSNGTINFDHVTFDLHLEKLSHFWFAYNFFLPYEIGLSYLACVFLMTRLFWWYHNFWSRNLDRDLWPTFGKSVCHTFGLLITCLPWEKGL